MTSWRFGHASTIITRTAASGGSCGGDMKSGMIPAYWRKMGIHLGPKCGCNSTMPKMSCADQKTTKNAFQKKPWSRTVLG